MKSKIIIILIVFSLVIATANAHPGRTDSKGGHTCRTNCEAWGLEDGEYHYRNGGYKSTPTSTPSQTLTSTATPTPLITQTPIVTITSSDPILDRSAIVTSIVDGDTVYIDYKEKVRFVGINTPEIGTTGSLEAKNYVVDRINGKQVYLDVDNKNPKDKYGRILAVILINGENLNKELLCKGYAEVMYIPPSEFEPNSWQASCSNSPTMTATDDAQLKRETSLNDSLIQTERNINPQEKKTSWLEKLINSLFGWLN